MAKTSSPCFLYLLYFIIKEFKKWLKPGTYSFLPALYFIIKEFKKWLKLVRRYLLRLWDFIIKEFKKWLKLDILSPFFQAHFIIKEFKKWLKPAFYPPFLLSNFIIKEFKKWLKHNPPKLKQLRYFTIKEFKNSAINLIAKITKLDLLSDIQDSLIKAQKQGKSFESWKKDIKPILAKKGWLGVVDVTNEKTGEVKTINVNNTRLKRIYNTNMRTANAQGRARAQYALEGDIYLRYIALQDGLTRPSHLRMHGITLHRDDPFWNTNYPPNGWNCRCVVRAYSKSECEAQGFEISKTPPLPVASADWSYDKRGLNKDESLETILESKLKKFEKNPNKSVFAESLKEIPNAALKKTWQTSLNAMVDEVLVKGNQSYPVNMIQVGKMDSKTQKFLESKLQDKLSNLYFMLTKNNLLHASPTRKSAYNQALRIEEFREIINVLEEAKSVYWSEKEQSLLYFFDDKENADKVNKIIVRPQHKIKKFNDKTNVIVTLGKVDKETSIDGTWEKVK